MKKRTIRWAIIAIVLVAVAIATIAAVDWVSAQTPAAQEIVGKSMENLTVQGVPVKFWALEGTTLTVSLQSASTTAVGTPNDPAYLNLVQREAFLAKSRGVELSLLKLDLTNIDGSPLFVGEIPLNEELPIAWSASPLLSEADTIAALRRALTDDPSISGLALDSVSMDISRGAREVDIAATVPAVESASGPTTALMLGVHRAVGELNDHEGAQIALVQINMVDKTGQALLKWIYDVQRGAQDWWQAPGMTTDWFESPPPDDAAAKTAIGAQ